MNEKQIVTEIEKGKSWLLQHERMVICALVLVIAMFLGNKWLDNSAAKAQTQAVVAAQLAAEAKLSAQQAATQAALTASQYQAMVDALEKQNATLASAITQRDAILGKQQAAVQVAPLPEVAHTWQVAIGGQDDILSSTAGMIVTDSGARRTVEMLLALPVAQANLADQKEIAKNLTSELGKSNDLTSALGIQVTALNIQTAANDKACKTEVASVKATANKSKVKWFRNGFIVGFVAGLWTSHAVGL